MEDHEIIDLYWQRTESAIGETASKYGRLCYLIAYHILGNHRDSEECVNDTYLQAWDSIPPQRPENLPAFLGKIVRNLALNRHKFDSTEKRGGSQVLLALDELTECLPTSDGAEQLIDNLVLVEVLNRFLAGVLPEARIIFLRRYWYFSSVREIAKSLGIGQSKVKMSLLRSWARLKEHLRKEGIFV